MKEQSTAGDVFATVLQQRVCNRLCIGISDGVREFFGFAVTAIRKLARAVVTFIDNAANRVRKAWIIGTINNHFANCAQSILAGAAGLEIQCFGQAIDFAGADRNA